MLAGCAPEDANTEESDASFSLGIRMYCDSPGPFFIDLDMRAFTKGQFVSKMRSILNMAGLPQYHYAGHSTTMLVIAFE